MPQKIYNQLILLLFYSRLDYHSDFKKKPGEQHENCSNCMNFSIVINSGAAIATGSDNLR